MTPITDASLTVSEAAFVVGLTERIVNREIDERIIRPSGGQGERRLSGPDLLYLNTIKKLRTEMGPPLRRRIRDAIVTAVDARQNEARVEHFTVSLDQVEQDISVAYRALTNMKAGQIELRSDVMAGEPVLKGTRISVRHVAELLRNGATKAEITEDFDLSPAQIEAAIVFDQVTPKRGRPAGRRGRSVLVPAA